MNSSHILSAKNQLGITLLNLTGIGMCAGVVLIVFTSNILPGDPSLLDAVVVLLLLYIAIIASRLPFKTTVDASGVLTTYGLRGRHRLYLNKVASIKRVKCATGVPGTMYCLKLQSTSGKHAYVAPQLLTLPERQELQSILVTLAQQEQVTTTKDARSYLGLD